MAKGFGTQIESQKGFTELEGGNDWIGASLGDVGVIRYEIFNRSVEIRGRRIGK